MDEPLLDLRVYKYPMFALASVIAIVNAVAMFSGMILTPAYVQNVRGISPLSSGLMMLPGAVIMGVMSPITGKLFDKYGPRILGIVGLSITAVSTYMLANLQLDSSHTYYSYLHIADVWDGDGDDATYDKWPQSIANALKSARYSC